MVINFQKWILLFFGIYSFTVNSVAQSKKLDSLILSNLNIEQKINVMEEFLEKEINNDSIPYLYNKFSYWLFKHDLEKSIEYSKKAITCIKESNIENNELLQDCLYDLGFTYRKKEDYHNAIDVFKEIILIDPLSDKSVKSYNRLALCYGDLQDHVNAIEYYKYYKNDLENRSPKSLSSLFLVYYNIASNQLAIKTKDRLENGIMYAKKADSLGTILSLPPSWKFRIKFVLAELYDQHLSKNITKSNSYYDQALQIANSIPDTSRIRNVYYGKSNLYNNIDFKKSLAYLDTLSNFINPKGKVKVNVYRYRYSKGHAYAYNGDFEKSIKNYSYAINALIGIPQEKFENLEFNDLKGTPYDNELLYIIPLIAETYLAYYQETKDEDKLDLAIHYFNIADQIIDSLKANSTEFTSRLFWSNLRSKLYGKAIKACYLKNNVELAFYFSEKSKALLLLEDLAKESYIKAIHYSNIEREKNLKKQISDNEKLLTKNVSKEIQDSLQKENIYIKTKLSMLDKKKASDIEINTSIIPLDELQKTMKSDEVFLEYHMSINDDYRLNRNNENGFLFVITKSK